MPLFLHLSIHIILSLLAGFVVFMAWRKPLASFTAAFLGGVLVDFDHFVDYFLAFGSNFKFDYFFQGYQFLKSGKLYLLFHGWEYVIGLTMLVFIVKNKALKSVFLGVALGLFLHLCADVAIDGLPIKSYSLIWRMKNNFNVQRLVTPEHWQRHLKEREAIKFDL